MPVTSGCLSKGIIQFAQVHTSHGSPSLTLDLCDPSVLNQQACRGARGGEAGSESLHEAGCPLLCKMSGLELGSGFQRPDIQQAAKEREAVWAAYLPASPAQTNIRSP